MLAPRVCRIQFVGNQEWYVFPKGRWGKLRDQYWSAWSERPVGAAGDMVLLVVCFLLERWRCCESGEGRVQGRDGGLRGSGLRYNEGDQEGVALIQCANDHFAIYKSSYWWC
jgi:hypothetical protein